MYVETVHNVKFRIFAFVLQYFVLVYHLFSCYQYLQFLSSLIERDSDKLKEVLSRAKVKGEQMSK